MKKYIRSVFFILILFFISCSPTKLTIDDYTSPEFDKEVIRTVAVMQLITDNLNDEEIKETEEKFLEKAQLKYKDVVFFGSDSYKNINDKNKADSVILKFWKNFLDNGDVDAVALYDISELIKANAILQSEILDIKKVFGSHRKTIGETTVKIKYALFSLKSGKLLWEATVEGTQANAHSDQTVPKVIEAVDVVVRNVVERLPFN